MVNENYDVVVIGSGIGGLSAAVLLAHSGYKTLLVENLDRLGGRWSTIEREGFKLTTGAILLHRGVFTDIFQQVGAEFQATDAPNLYYMIEGKTYELPPKGGIAALLEIVNKLEVQKAKLVGRIVKEVAVEKIKSAMRREKYEEGKDTGFTFRDWLLQYTDNELAHQIFDTIIVAQLNVRSHEVPANQFFQFMARMGGFRTPCVVNQGNLSAAESLAKVIRRNGDVWLNCPAKKLIIKKGTISGIVVEKNGTETEVTCRAIISDVGPKRTVELAGEENFTEEYLRTMRVRLRPSPAILVLVGSDKPLIMEKGEKAAVLVIGARRMTSAIPVTNTCPELAPPGQHFTYFCGEPTSSLHHVDKEEEMKKFMLDIKELFPEFEKHGRILDASVRDIDDEFPESRTWAGRDMPRETPIKNLFNVGDAVKSVGMTGTAASAESGKLVAETVKKQVKV
jgi:phytoene dehydrogenase-like protein